MAVTEALMRTGRTAGYLSVGLLAESGLAKLSEVMGKPEWKPFVKLGGGALFGVLSDFVREPVLKDILLLAGGYNIVAGVKDLLQSRGVLTFQEMPVVEVVEEKKKKPEIEVLAQERPLGVEVF